MIGNYIVMNGGATSATFTFTNAVVVKSINLEGLFTSFGTTDNLTFTTNMGDVFTADIDGYNGQSFYFPYLPTGIASFTITKTDGGTLNYEFDNISATVHKVHFTDGISYTPPALTPNTTDNPIGQFRLSTTIDANAILDNIVVLFNGAHSGLSNFRLWKSPNSTFTYATLVTGRLDFDDTYSSISLYGLNSTVSGSNNFYYITVDVGPSPSGTIEVSLDGLNVLGGTHDFDSDLLNPLSSGTQPLPVELTSFTAKVVHNKVNLNWQTATEVNNFGFEIERSQSISKNEDNWTKIGFVEGNGTSNSPKEYSFPDNSNLLPGKYSYRLKQIDNKGSYKYSKTVEISTAVPERFVLEQNYPNPFNPATTIKYDLPSKSFVSLKIYDVLGTEVASLVNEEEGEGEHSVSFNANELSSGVYFYRLAAGNFNETKKMLLTK